MMKDSNATIKFNNMPQMKKIKLDEETTKRFREALETFMVNPKKGNAMLDKIHEEQQHDDAEKFHREFRDCRVTCDKNCKNCLGSSVDEEGKFYCEYYKN